MQRGTGLVSWRLVYTKQAQKDAKKLAAAGLKKKAQAIIDILQKNPFQTLLHMKNLSAICQASIPGESTSSTGWFIRF
jgi:hypothetical protein